MAGRALSAVLVSLFLVALTAATSFAADADRLDLRACVRRALAQNLQVEDARDAVSSAELGQKAALAEYELKTIPSIDGGLQGSNRTNQNYELAFTRKLLQTGTELTLSGGTHVYSSVPQLAIPYLTETRVALAQPLFQGWSRFETHERIDDAARKLTSTAHAVASASEDLSLRVVQGYYDVLRAEELTRVGEASLERVAALGHVAEEKLSLGLVSKMDVFRADLHAARLRGALVAQRARREAALDALKSLLGLDPRVRLEIDARMQGPAASDLQGEKAEDTALERRVEVIEAREQLSDSERKLVLARYRLWPAVDLVGSYARQGLGNTFGESTRLDRDEWSAGLRSSFPLERTQEKIAVAEAELSLRGRERRYRATRDEVVQQVRDALRQLERIGAESALAAEVAEQADRQAELARYRYEKGVTDNLDLVQAEEQRAEAKGALVLSTIDQAVAAAVVRRSTQTLAEAFVEPASNPPVDTPPPAIPPGPIEPIRARQ